VCVYIYHLKNRQAKEKQYYIKDATSEYISKEKYKDVQRDINEK